MTNFKLNKAKHGGKHSSAAAGTGSERRVQIQQIIKSSKRACRKMLKNPSFIQKFPTASPSKKNTLEIQYDWLAGRSGSAKAKTGSKTSLRRRQHVLHSQEQLATSKEKRGKGLQSSTSNLLFKNLDAPYVVKLHGTDRRVAQPRPDIMGQLVVALVAIKSFRW